MPYRHLTVLKTVSKAMFSIVLSAT